MLKGRMSLACIWSLQQLRHGLLPFSRRSRHSILERLVKANRIRHRGRTAKSKPQIPEVMHSHPRHDDQNVLLAKTRDCLSEAVVLVWVFGVKERDLHDGNVQWVRVWLEGCIVLVSIGLSLWSKPSRTALEADPDAVVESALHALGWDIGFFQQPQHFICYLLATHVRVLLFIVMAWEATEATYN